MGILDQSNELSKFKLAVDNVSDHVVITDPEGNVIYGNKMVEKVTGYSLQEVLGKKAGSLWKKPMKPSFYKKLWKTIKIEKKVFEGEVQNIRKNGEVYDASISISPVLDSDGNILHFVGIERDVSKEKKIDRAKSEFVMMVSHQLRTPLSAVRWFTEFLLVDKKIDQKKRKEYLNRIYKSNEQMAETVDLLLNITRVELGTFSPEKDKLNLKKLADFALEEIRPTLIQKKISLSKKFSKNLELVSDRKLLMMVLQNLLSNAVKYTSNNGKISFEITKGSSIEIKVGDSGVGIPKNEVGKVFSKMYRGKNVKNFHEGTGLGLYMVKQIVDRLSGKIWFESVENIGTTFYVSLPIK